MKLLLDEMLAPAIAHDLRARGHDVASMRGDPRLEARSDEEVAALARSQGRAVVTNNVRDFRPLHHQAVVPGGPGNFGMVFMAGDHRRTRADIGRTVDALEAVLLAHQGDRDLADAEAWL